MSQEPPYGVIADALNGSRVVPFLGAGVNLGGQPADGTRLPSGYELSRRLAKKTSFPAEAEADLGDLLKVASYYVEASGRRNLLRELHTIFNQDYAPCKIHEYLAEIARPLLIVTTNYDDLTERAFRAQGRPFDLVVHPTQRSDLAASVLWWKHGEREPVPEDPNKLPMNERLKTTTVIYKMHGTVVRPWHRGGEPTVEDDGSGRDDSYVITEEDYIDFLHRMTQRVAVPTQFMDYFSSRQFLFLGYGLRDWNLRVVLKNLNSVLNSFDREEDADPSWAIQGNPSILEKKLWERRRVDIYDQDINEFVDKLRGL